MLIWVLGPASFSFLAVTLHQVLWIGFVVLLEHVIIVLSAQQLATSICDQVCARIEDTLSIAILGSSVITKVLHDAIRL